ncbi:MAG: hypothetical protein JW395_4118 [Nitrospira sp.]|nr:hypothetical protein [Nitrospira sp.]
MFLVASLSALLFWFIEGSWKTFQYSHYDRSGDIEEYFRGEKKIQHPFQIGASWYKRWKSGGSKRLLRILFWPHVAMPHAAVAFIGLAFFIAEKIGIVRV